MEERKNNGNSVFLGIVGVATLIVAIIGASFAYFSAQTSSAENAVDLTAYEFNASLSFEEVYPSSKELIPVDPVGEIANATEPNDKMLAYALNVKKSCEDEHKLKICALYKATITNGGTNDLNLKGSIVTTLNEASSREGATPFANLQYREVTLDGDTYTVGTEAKNLATTAGETISIGNLTVTSSTPVTKYILVYLNDNGDQSAEMGAHFQGQVVFASEGTNTNKLTGTFTVAAE